MRLLSVVAAVGLLLSVACHGEPVINTGPKTPSVDGTVAGIVSMDTNEPVAGRKVTAINLETGARFEATTGANGGYTIKIPEGRYRLEVELRPGERVAKQPDETRINRSDLDPQRHFVITLGRDEASSARG